ncbi:MAG: hypothetical protein IPG86_21020 [Chitinophagaceae bacterium]|nr:hypothetical protein [Chitinophagaceae bacterium]
MVAGPSAIVGGAGYNALSYTFPVIESSAIDLAIEILDDGTVAGGLRASTNRDYYNLWDFSVYSGTTEKKAACMPNTGLLMQLLQATACLQISLYLQRYQTRQVIIII